MKNSYQKQIELINDQSLFDLINICDFSEYIQKNEFEYIFENITKIFKAEAKKYKLNTPLFYFSDFDSLNARALSTSNFHIIVFNKGLVRISIEEILENEELKKFNLSFINIAEYLNISLERLNYQFTYLFTFYHEFAHLLQKCKFEINMSEENGKIHTDILHSHYKELDADAYSSVQLARHIDEYCVKMFEVQILKECIVGITAIFCSNLLYQLMRFPSANKALYFEENTHPHSFIRILNIIAVVSIYINSDQNLIAKGVQISKEDLFEPIVDEVMRLQKVYNNENINKFREAAINQIEDITSYITKVSKNKPEEVNSAIEVYNRHI